MSAPNEHRIVCRILLEQEFQPALDRGVNKDWFFNDNHRDAFDFIAGHVEKYGRVPSKPTFMSHMGTTYKLFGVTESLEYLLDAQADACRWQAAKRMLPDVEDALTARNTQEAVEFIETYLAKINSFSPVPSRLVDSMSSMRADERWAEYEAREKGGHIVGLTTGFPTIDEATLGLQDGHLVTVLAQPKVGKTTLCLAMANHIYEESEKTVLFVSFEMGIRELEMRQESLMAGINFKHLQSGKLVALERKKYQRYIEVVKDDFDWPFHIMDASSGATVGAIRAQIERFDPDVVFLDGIYMMIDEQTGETNTAQSLTNITRSLKRLATNVQKPIVINTQALGWKSKGHRISMDSAGYSSSFAQDSDVILGLERLTPGKGEDDATYAFQRNLRVLASRNTGLASVELYFDYGSGTIEESS